MAYVSELLAYSGLLGLGDTEGGALAEFELRASVSL